MIRTTIGAIARVGIRRSLAIGRFNALPSVLIGGRIPSLNMSSPKKVRDDNLLTLPSAFDAERFFDDLDYIMPLFKPEFGNAFHLAMDLKEKKDCFEIIVDLPGCKKDSIHLQLINNRLTISADRHSTEKKDENDRHIRRERHSHFSRTLSIPESVDVDQIDASYDNGVLTVKLPKVPHSDNSHSRTIQLK